MDTNWKLGMRNKFRCSIAQWSDAIIDNAIPSYVQINKKRRLWMSLLQVNKKNVLGKECLVWTFHNVHNVKTSFFTHKYVQLLYAYRKQNKNLTKTYIWIRQHLHPYIRHRWFSKGQSTAELSFEDLSS